MGCDASIARGPARPAARGLRHLGVVFAVLGCASAPASADYKLRPGDILALSVVGMPDLAAKAMVDGDGKARFPVAGELAVAGSSVAEVTAKLQAILPARELTTHLPDGRQVPKIIAPVEISLAIAEYRPVYVDGDVTKPGAVPFRPGMSVRQAIALAGGLGPSHTAAADPLAQTLELTGTYNELTVAFAKTQLRVARLEAERDGRFDLDPKTVADLPVAQKLRDDLAAGERQLMMTRAADHEKERTYLASAARHEQQRAGILDQQEAKDSEGVKIDEADLQRLEDLFKKGAIALPTLSEARRTVLQSSTRALQTTASLASVQRDQGELERRLERLGETRQTEILTELADARALLATTRAQLRSVSAKLRYAGLLKPQVAPGLDQVKVTVVRDADGLARPFAADLDSGLEAGDSLVVAQPSADGANVGQ